MVCSFPSNWFMQSLLGVYPLFRVFQSHLNFCFRRVLASLYEMEDWVCGRQLPVFANRSAFSLPATQGTTGGRPFGFGY